MLTRNFCGKAKKFQRRRSMELCFVNFDVACHVGGSGL